MVIGSKITTVSVTFLVATEWNRRKAQLSMNVLFCVVVRKSVHCSSGVLLKQLQNTFHFIIDTQPVQQRIFLTVVSSTFAMIPMAIFSSNAELVFDLLFWWDIIIYV